MTRTTPAGGPRRPSRRVLVAGALGTVAALAAGGAVYASAADPQPAPRAAQATSRPAVPVPVPAALLAGVTADGTVPWQDPLSVSVVDGTLTTVEVLDAAGATVQGALGPDGSWSSSTALLPGETYALTAVVRDAAGAAQRLPLSARTAAADDLLTASLSPGDGKVVGVGQPVAVRLDGPVTTKAARALVEKRLTVVTDPPVPGSWRWMSDNELHYRGADFWAPGTTISVSTDLDRLALPGGTFGSGKRTSSFTIGDALTSVVDTNAHTMTVSRNGQVLKVMKASMGKPEFATRNGTFLVLEKFADRVMDSATVDLPPGTPAYRTAVKDAVRISNSGTFTHGAPWSVKSQGVANVSHGCVNLSPADAHWYFEQAKRGDVVTVVGSTRGPLPYDAGSQDWNMDFATWKAGSALA